MNDLMVVEKGNLGVYREGLIEEQRAAVRIAEEIIKIANERNLPTPKESSRALTKGQARLKALNAGFLPTEGISTVVIPKRPLRKKRGEFDWALRNQRRILAVVDDLPSQVKEAIVEAESLGIFDKISISSPRVSADPVIVGNAGGWKFLIASWVDLMDGQGVGFRFRLVP